MQVDDLGSAKAARAGDVSGLQQQQIVQTFLRWRLDVETHSRPDVLGSFARERRGVVQLVPIAAVGGILEKHPEVLEPRGGRWMPAGRAGALSRVRRQFMGPGTGLGVPIPDSPLAPPVAGERDYRLQLRDLPPGHGLPWECIPSMVRQLLLDARVNGVTVSLWQDDAVFVRIPISLVLDDEPVWLAAVRVE